MRSSEYLTPADVARRFLVSPITVRQWTEKGWLAAIITPGGHRRFDLDEVERFARDRAKITGTKSGARVLVVDDDVQLAGFLTELLETSFPGIDVRVAHDGFTAGRQVQTFLPHVMLLDLMMPGIDGFQACADLKSNPAVRSVRVLAMSGYATPENVERILSAGAQDCFEKPLDLPRLLDAIGQAIGMDAEVARRAEG